MSPIESLTDCTISPRFDQSFLSHLNRIAKAVVFLAPFFYLAATSPSITDRWFGIDDTWQLDYVRNGFSTGSWFGPDGFHLFRPVKNWLFLLFSYLEPIGIEWCHVISICLGALAFFPVLALCRRIFQSEGKAVVAALVWLFSPTLVSSVAWLSCTNISIMVSFAALAVATHDSAWDGGSFRAFRSFLAGVFLFVSLVSYECAVAVVPILLLFDLLLRSDRMKNTQTWRVHFWYFCVLVFYMFLRHLASARTMANGAGSWADASRWQLVVSSPYFTVQHAASWFCPFNRFVVLGSYKWGDAGPWVLVSCWFLVLALLGCAFVFRRRFPVLCFCILFSFLGFAPTSNCLGFGNGPYGDYYLALSSIGIASACVEAACLLSRTTGSWRIPALGVVVAFSLTRGFAVIETARWSRLWSRTDMAVKESFHDFPLFLSNKVLYVRVLAEQERYEEALALGKEIEKETGPDSQKMANVYLVRSLYALNVLRSSANVFELLDRCESVARLGSGISRQLLQYYRGCAHEDLDDNEAAAKAEYETALQGNWGVDLVPCADRLARLKAIHGELNEAIALWEKAARLDSENVAVLWNLAVAYRNAGEIEKSDVLRKQAELSSRKRLP